MSPPLYALKTGRESLYLKTKSELLELKVWYVYDKVIDIYIGDIKLVEAVYQEFCTKITEIGSFIREMADILIIDPKILERLVMCVGCLNPDNPDVKTIKEILKIQEAIYRQDSKTLILVSNDIELIIRLDGVNNIIKNRLLPKLKSLRWDQISFSVSTKLNDSYVKKVHTIMELYDLFEKLDTVFSLTRFKGLGQMSNGQLLESCVDKNSRVCYTITGIGDIEKFYNIFGADTKARKKLIKK